MFVLLTTYVKPIEEIDQFLAEHRQMLSRKYEEGLLVCSGPQNPRTGGVIVARTSDRKKVDQLIAEDPFHREGLAEYEVIEFDPVKMDPAFAALLDPKANTGPGI